jgi:hypothetical protein
MRTFLAVFIVTLFTACATESANGPVASATPAKPQGEAKKVKLICTNEKTVGSNFSERVCRRVGGDAGDEAQRDATQRDLLRPHAFQKPGQ